MNIKNSILGYVVGDSLGLEKKYGNYVGSFSANTSFLIATMDSLLDSNKLDFIDISNKYLSILNYAKYTANSEIIDLGSTTMKSIMKYDGNNPVNYGDNSFYSNGNGALARMLPIALFLHTKKDQEFRKTIIDFSSITHNNEISLMGCYIFSKYVQFLIQGKSKEIAFKLLKELDYSDFNIKTINYYKKIFNNNFLLNAPVNSDFIVDTLETVFYVILTTNNIKDAIKLCLKINCDANTVTALVGGLAGLIYGEYIKEYEYTKMDKIEQISMYFEKFIIEKNKYFV